MDFYSAIILLTVLAMLVMLSSVLLNFSMSKRTRINSIVFIIFIIACSVCEWCGNYYDNKGGNLIWLHILVKVIELSCAPFVGILPIYAIRDRKSNRFDRIIFCFMALNIIIQIISVFNGFIFYVDSANLYHHGKFYFIYVMFFLISILYFCYSIILICKRQQKKFAIPNLLTALFVVIAIFIQLTNSNVKVDWICIGIGAIMLFKINGDMVSQTDGLTGLLNRLEYEHRVKNTSKNVLIIYFDVNKFKNVNDQYGHLYGDICLCNVASAIKKVYGGYGRAYRFGGDEFCVILTKDFNIVDDLNKKFAMVIDSYIKKDSRMPTVAYGYAIYDPHNDNIIDVLNKADQKMYDNKN